MSLAAADHARTLTALGHEVSILGAHPSVINADLPVVRRLHVAASGSGALYAPTRIDRIEVLRAIKQTHAELVVTEAWQTALTDTCIEVATDLDLPVLMVSHGISIDPFDGSLSAKARALAWWPYARWRLPSLIRRLSAMTALDLESPSPRFRDRDLGRAMGVPVLMCANAPVHWTDDRIGRSERDSVVLVVGYYSAVKNQLGALEVANQLRNRGLRFRFVGPRTGSYFRLCQERARALGLMDRVEFLEDGECDLGREMGRALLVFAPSLTEALPVTLIEASASRTPFVATPVGAIPSMRGGASASTIDHQVAAIDRLLDDATHWETLSNRGRDQYERSYRHEVVQAALKEAVQVAAERGSRP